MEAEASMAAEGLSECPPAKRPKHSHHDDEEGDVFGFGGDFGPAAYQEDVPVQSAVVRPCCPSSPRSDPVGSGPGDAAPSATVQTSVAPVAAPAPFVAASLSGIEDRLVAWGEVPRFRKAGPGRLQHICNTAAATIYFWPGSLKWCVEGDDSSAVEHALIGFVCTQRLCE